MKCARKNSQLNFAVGVLTGLSAGKNLNASDLRKLVAMWQLLIAPQLLNHSSPGRYYNGKLLIYFDLVISNHICNFIISAYCVMSDAG